MFPASEYTDFMLPSLLLFMQLGEHQAALAAYKQHQFPEAVAHFTEALKTEKPGSPEYDESVLLLGQTLFLETKYAEAIPWLEKATSGKTVTPEASYMLGNACILTRQPDKAVQAFAILFHVEPNSAAAHLTTAQMMLHHDMDAEAARQAKAALALDPRIPEAHFLLGEVAILHAEIDNAIGELNQEIAINPGYAMAYYRLGDAYSRREEWDKAMSPLERSVWLNPNYSAPFILLGKGYLKMKELANADGVLRHALVLDPQNLSAHYLLGQTLMQEGKVEEAKKEMALWQELKGDH
jgi:tetratricopeptide (TPR) repeat protein